MDFLSVTSNIKKPVIPENSQGFTEIKSEANIIAETANFVAIENKKKATEADLAKKNEDIEHNQKAAQDMAKVVFERYKKKYKDNPDFEVKMKGNDVIVINKATKEKTTRTIAANGKTSEKKIEKGEGQNKTISITKYGADGKKESTWKQEGVGDSASTTTTYFDKNGKKTKQTQRLKVNGKDATIQREFNANGTTKKKTITSVDANGKETKKTTNYTYDKNGLLKSMSESQDGKTVIKNYTYKNKDNANDGNYTSEVEVIVTKNGKTTTQTIVNTYKNGKLSKTETTDSDGKKLRTSTYEYDKDGNKTKHVTQYFGDDGKVSHTTTRINFEKVPGGTRFDYKIDYTDNNIPDKEGKQTNFVTGESEIDDDDVNKDVDDDYDN